MAERLFDEPYAFDFFQAVRLLNRIEPGRAPVGFGGPPSAEVVRFRSHISLSFPPSAVHDLSSPSEPDDPPVMVQAFLGLSGPSGVLPRHYTELLLRLERDQKGSERHSLRDWFDLFNHRATSLFHRAWEKYRLYRSYEREQIEHTGSDPFRLAFLSLIGLGTPALQRRIHVIGPPRQPEARTERPTLARIEDLALIYFSGLLAHRPRNALGLEALIHGYFGLPVEVHQFEGQWLSLGPENQTRLGPDGGNNRLGVNALTGERAWDVQGRFRVRLGPLSYDQFRLFLPEQSSRPASQGFFLLCQLVRLYVGPEFDFDVQLVLQAPDVPDCQLPIGNADGPGLGWSTWLRSQPFIHDANDPVFMAEEVPNFAETGVRP